ncbi:MAG: hypothetical protein Q9170_006336, partial [Blastenia crenularia]
MGRELQKKKNKSSIPRAKLKPKSKKLNLRANPIVAANWSQKETLSQNYRRLGLVSKLNARTGGIEKRPATISNKEGVKDPLAIANKNPTTLVLGTARIERDPDTGAILRVISDGDDEKRRGKREWNGRVLRDELDDGLDDEVEMGQHNLPGLPDGAGGGGEGVVPELVLRAAMGGEKKRPRKQSRREEEWMERLVE